MHDLKKIENLEEQNKQLNHMLNHWVKAYDELEVEYEKLEEQNSRAEYIRIQQLQYIQKLTEGFINYDKES
jgi:regulator of sigma D